VPQLIEGRQTGKAIENATDKLGELFSGVLGASAEPEAVEAETQNGKGES
jgi:hypothetical protein